MIPITHVLEMIRQAGNMPDDINWIIVEYGISLQHNKILRGIQMHQTVRDNLFFELSFPDYHTYHIRRKAYIVNLLEAKEINKEPPRLIPNAAHKHYGQCQKLF